MKFNLVQWFEGIRKFAVAAAGAAAVIVSLHLVHGQALQWTETGISVATALGVYTVRNRTVPPVSVPPAPAVTDTSNLA